MTGTPAPDDELAELRALVTRLTNRVNDLEDQLLESGYAVDDVDEPARGRHADLEQFVTETFAVMLRRRVGQQQRWCKQWWLHAEAVFRLDGLWRAYEAYKRQDPELGAANWTRDYLDPCVTVLFSGQGPFAACTPDRHEHDAGLPLIAPPIGMFAEGDVIHVAV